MLVIALCGLVIANQVKRQRAIGQALGIDRAELFSVTEHADCGDWIGAEGIGPGQPGFDPRTARPEHVSTLEKADCGLHIAQFERCPSGGDQGFEVLRTARQLTQRIVQLHPRRFDRKRLDPSLRTHPGLRVHHLRH